MDKSYDCMFGKNGPGNYIPCPHLKECNLNGMNRSPLNKSLDIEMNNPVKFKKGMEEFLEGINEHTHLDWFRNAHNQLYFTKCFYKNK